VAGSYFLVVGTREPRKNFKTVAQAYVTLPEALRRRFPLLWVGPSGWGDVGLSVAAGQAIETGQIRIIGYVPDRDLAALYRNTMLFLMPSIYEGFGMPLVEALACGAPAAISKIPVFEEIAGRCARYVEPLDIEAWRSAMQDAIDTRGASIINGEASIDLARFSWHASAGVTLDLYRRCLSVVGN
jgi:alpha-1,3-rhamnosyl/mannosyltransferase